VERLVVSDWPVQSAGSYVAALDPELTDALRREGLARELVNRIQRLRKDAGYEYTARIEVSIEGPAPLLDAARDHEAVIRSETLARVLHIGAAGPASDRQETLDIDGHQAVIAVQRYVSPPTERP
jgi:isoleucyl-tRNA synthetase